MFTNLIESGADMSAFKRRSSFFLATVAGYALILFAASIAGILGYDARVEAQTSSLELLEWVPPVNHTPDRQPDRDTRPIRRLASNAPVDPNATKSERTSFVATANDPTRVPDDVGIKGSDIPPVIGKPVLSNRNVDPPGVPSNSERGCVTCSGTDAQPRVAVDNDTPPPTPVKQTQRLSSKVLASKAISLPQPPYPTIAKQMGAQGPVNVQILVDETGRVISAHVLSGHATLVTAAKEAALRARFTPTLLNDKPVKVQGVIIYNFVLR